MCTNDFPPGEFEPRNLSQEEINDPFLLIEELFAYGHLPEIREELWLFLKACATGDFTKVLTWRERSNLFCFYELMTRLVEGLYLIYKRRKAASTTT